MRKWFEFPKSEKSNSRTMQFEELGRVFRNRPKPDPNLNQNLKPKSGGLITEDSSVNRPQGTKIFGDQPNYI